LNMWYARQSVSQSVSLSVCLSVCLQTNILSLDLVFKILNKCYSRLWQIYLFSFDIKIIAIGWILVANYLEKWSSDTTWQ